MKALIIGAPGQLGQDLCAVYSDVDLYQADLKGAPITLDITDEGSVRDCIVDSLRPDLVINTAAAHNVPRCEETPDIAYAVNATGARNLARACNAAGARLVHISTDYVYGHGHHEPLTEAVPPAPLSSYGASKVAGEYLIAAECPEHLIVRTAAIYGTAPCLAKGGMNFVSLMLHLADKQGWVKVVTDEVTTPTYTEPLARQIRLAAEKGEPGLYHMTCQGACSWYDFTKTIFELTNTEVDLKQATTADFPSPVKRPTYSVLENAHLQVQGINIMPPWRDALEAYLKASGRV